MKNIVKLFGIIALVVIIGFTMAACGGDDGGGGGGDNNNPGGGGNPVWPVEFGGTTQNGTSWGQTSYISFYTATGGSGVSAYMQFTGSQEGFKLVSVNGKTLKVKVNTKDETVYTLCTNWTITDDKLTLSGGDPLFSTITNTPLPKIVY